MNSYKTFELNKSLINSRIRIKNEILSACIGYGSKVQQYKFITGFCDKKRNGYAILIEFISILFEKSKLPIQNDRVYSWYRNDSDVKGLIESLSKSQLSEIITELNEVYRNTQILLNSAGVTHVNLRREIAPKGIPHRISKRVRISQFGIDMMSYDSLLMLYKVSANILGYEKIPVHMDVLNSFTDTNDRGGYGSISLNFNIPIEDVMYSYLTFPSDQMEGEEWIVINRSPTGIIELPVSNLTINDKRVESFYNEIYSHLSSEYAQKLFDLDYSKIWGNVPHFCSRFLS
ncbi:hypothetical protein NL54_03250 [Pantoea stewartii]|uniref:hypothetical protein n=1 Tax=Pantoea stewartii TaxID=66269 RepID=UPI0005439990|nr:hypothetical protein [Pantoea stewartii]KHE02657.1 hypothetical protein NL54_03250 [Pantoea stewartii]KHN64531.1 hypothetical protein OI73_05835 [Pantoea stewartii]